MSNRAWRIRPVSSRMRPSRRRACSPGRRTQVRWRTPRRGRSTSGVRPPASSGCRTTGGASATRTPWREDRQAHRTACSPCDPDHPARRERAAPIRGRGTTLCAHPERAAAPTRQEASRWAPRQSPAPEPPGNACASHRGTLPRHRLRMNHPDAIERFSTKHVTGSLVHSRVS